MIDTHAHLNLKAFDKDRDEVISRCFDNGVDKIIVPGTKLDTSKSAIELAQDNGGIFAGVGLHPTDVENEDFDIEKYRQLVAQDKVVAVGEIGLDYFYRHDEEFKNKQKDILRQFISLAQELNLPMILHSRGSKDNPEDAYHDILEILDSQKYYNGVIHCFTSTPEIAREFFGRGLYIGFTGVVTFAKNLSKVVEVVSLDKILIETDCPWLSPEPKRGERCEPWYVRFTAEKIAEIKGLALEEFLHQIDISAYQIFKI